MMFLAGGCATTPPSQFYVLTPMERHAAAASTTTATSGNEISVGVGPLQLADYLEGPQLVTRPTPNRLLIEEFHRWGGTLQGNLLTVLAKNLAMLLQSDQVARYPWDEPVDPDYRVRLDVLQFDGMLGRSVDLDTRWEIVGPGRSDRYGLKLLRAGRVVHTEPVAGDSYEALVAAQSRAVAALSRELAGQLQEAASVRK